MGRRDLKKYLLRICLCALLPSLSAQSENRLLELTKPYMNGPDVMFLQQQLIYLGYDPGSDGADGWFGPRTSQMVKSYEEDHSLTIDGQWPSGTPLTDMKTSYSVSPLETVPARISPLATFRNHQFSHLEGSLSYHTYFGAFTVTYHTQGGPEPYLTLDVGRREFYVTSGFELSPDGRFLLMEQWDLSSSSGSQGFDIIDLLTGQNFFISYWKLDPEKDRGLRDTVYRVNLRWIDDNTIAANPEFDYRQFDGHPGHEEALKEELGELAGVSDPLDLGWYALSFGSPEAGEILGPARFVAKD